VSPAATAAITLNVISEKGPREEIQPRDLFWVVFRSFLLFVVRPKRYFGAKSLAGRFNTYILRVPAQPTTMKYSPKLRGAFYIHIKRK